VVPNVVTNPSLFTAPMVDPIKDFVPVAQLTSQSYVLLAHPHSRRRRCRRSSPRRSKAA
jgi:tripartite-type tricarboxylate transporter receptor subunit TctC